MWGICVCSLPILSFISPSTVMGIMDFYNQKMVMDTFHSFTRISSSIIDSSLPPGVHNYIGTTATNSLVCYSRATNPIPPTVSHRAISNPDNTTNNTSETKETAPPGARELLFTLRHYPILASLCRELHAYKLANFALASRTPRDTVEGTLGGGSIRGKTARWTCGGPETERFSCWRCNRAYCRVCKLYPGTKMADLAV